MAPFVAPSASQSVLLSLVTSFILTRLDYGSVTLNGITKCLMDRLQSVFNVAARLAHNSRKYDRISPLLCDLHWPELHWSLNGSSFVWLFLCSAVATRLHQTTWRQTYSGQTQTTRGDDCDRRQLRGCSCVTHNYKRSVTAPSATLFLHRHWPFSSGA